MLSSTDWADYLRVSTVGVSLTIASLVTSPVATLPPSHSRLSSRREALPITVVPGKAVASEFGDVYQWSMYDMAPIVVDESGQSQSVVEELLAIVDLPKEMVAHLAGVSRQAFHRWTTGGKITVENKRHLETLLATIRRLQALRGQDLRAFLQTPTPAGRPLDLLAAGDMRVVIGLALRQSSPATSPSTVSAAVRGASGIPSRLRPVKRLAHTVPRDRAAWEEARERLSPSPFNDALVAMDNEDDTPIFAAHVLAIN